MSDRHAEGDEHHHDDRHDHDHHHHQDHDHHHHQNHDQLDHDHHHHDLETVEVAVVTVSSTRAVEDDPAGDAIVAAFEDAGHELTHREVVGDEFDALQDSVGRLADHEDVDAVVTTGGTGVTPDDVTVEAVEALFDKRLPGFGELFRRLSFDEIGTRVVGTRATAGVVTGTPVFCLPGSENAARLGAEAVVVPEVSHLAGLARREGE